MTISDLLKEIIDSSKERVKTPISGAYALSFILWNWRPITLLLFEKATITQKIIVINSDYCNLMAIIGPFILCLLFTIGIPYIMTIIDKILEPAKKKRLKTIYLSKTNELTEQIELVVKELELQDKKNRSKTTGDFEEQISSLQNRLDTLNISNKTIVEDYENKLQGLSTVIQTMNVDRDKEKEISNYRGLMMNSEFNPEDFKFLRDSEISVNKIYHVSVIEQKLQNYLIKQEFIEKSNNGFRITKKGAPFFEFVKLTIDNNELKEIFTPENKK